MPSPTIQLDEVAGVLRGKFQWPDSDIAEAQQEIRLFANQVAVLLRRRFMAIIAMRGLTRCVASTLPNSRTVSALM